MSALENFLAHKPAVRPLTLEQHSLFLLEEERKVRKNCLVYIDGTAFWVDPPLAGKKITVRFNPNKLDRIEVYLHGKRYQTAYPFDPNSMAYRLCRQMSRRRTDDPAAPVCDFLGELAGSYRSWEDDSGTGMFIAVLDQLLQRPLDPVQAGLARKFWEDTGPFPLQQVEEAVKKFIAKRGTGLHIHYYLQILEKLPRGN